MLTFVPVTVIAFLLAIGSLIAIHEYGHFRVARALGFRVLTFSIGFGKTVWSRVGKDGVEYRLGLLPLGGYVRLLDAREGEVPAAEHAVSYQGRPPWARRDRRLQVRRGHRRPVRHGRRLRPRPSSGRPWARVY
jgi:RIP metalloprotease RseP